MACCSPLYYKDLDAPTQKIGGDKRQLSITNRLHVRWSNPTETLDVSTTFVNNISKCLTACDEGACKFIIISLYIYLGPEGGAHRNYIIIHNRYAYRIEPHGHGKGPQNNDKLDEELKKLFYQQIVTYEPHAGAGLHEIHLTGLQLTAELPPTVEKKPSLSKNNTEHYLLNKSPGLCNTFVFLYIRRIIDYSMNEGSSYSGRDLFHNALRTINRNSILSELHHKFGTIGEALFANQEISEFEVTLYTQLLEIPLANRVSTRLQTKDYGNRLSGAEEKVRLFHFDPKRDQLDIDMCFRTARILRGWDSDKMRFDILDIYGINFDALFQTMGGIQKKKKKKRKKKKITKRKKR